MEELQLAYTDYSLIVPLVLFAVYLWRRRESIKHPGRLVSSTVLAFSITLALSLWNPVKTPYGGIGFTDVGVMAVAMVFGPAIGGFAGSLGPALGASLTGGPVSVVLLARGLEGLLTGYVARNTEGSSGRILAGVLGGALAVTIFVGFAYASGAENPDAVLSTMLAEVSTGIILGTGISGIIKRKVPWTEDVL